MYTVERLSNESRGEFFEQDGVQCLKIAVTVRTRCHASLHEAASGGWAKNESPQPQIDVIQ